MSVATDTTEDENGLLVYQAAPTPIFREKLPGPRQLTILDETMVVSLTNAVNHSIKLTKPSVGVVVNWRTMGSGGGCYYVSLPSRQANYQSWLQIVNTRPSPVSTNYLLVTTLRYSHFSLKVNHRNHAVLIAQNLRRVALPMRIF